MKPDRIWILAVITILMVLAAALESFVPIYIAAALAIVGLATHRR